jgi:Uma2 family endonuclease
MSTYDESLRAHAGFDLPIAPQRRMSEDEFVAWCFKEDVRAEWVDGEVIVMSPNTVEHVAVFRFLIVVLVGFVESRDLGEVMGSELFVRLPKQRRRRLPDILFVSAARRDFFRKAHFEGAPDMIMEIVSPDSEARDWRDKYQEYEAAGVREYWVIDPMSEHVELYVLSEQQRYERVPESDGWLVSTAVPGFRLKTTWLWPATRPKAIVALKELSERAI